MMDRIVEILVKRDGITRAEAEGRCYECIDEATSMRGVNWQDLAVLIQDYFSLEEEYVEDILNEL